MSGPLLTTVGMVGIVLGAVFLAVAVLQYLTGASFAIACALTVFNFIAGIKVLRAASRPKV